MSSDLLSTPPPTTGERPAQRETSRTRRLLIGASSAILGKGAVVLASVASIPIMARYLGPERFGIWMTISTTVSMLLILDLGVASALVNFISEAFARDDREHASTYSTTAFSIMLCIALVLAGTGLVVWPRLNWVTLLHLSSAAEAPVASRAWAAAGAVFLFGLPAALAAKILGGYQEVRSANLFSAAGSLGSLLAVVVLVRLHAGLVTLVAVSSGALVGANLLCLGWIWFFHKPWLLPRAAHFSRAAARRMMGMGGQFFLLQIAALLAFNSDSLIVTHFLGPVQAASYAVTWRLVGYASVAQSLIAPALWPAYCEAFARNDLPWVRRTFWRTLWTTMGTALTFSILFALAGRTIIGLWATPASIPGEHLLLLMCGWVLLCTLMNNTAVVIAGKGELGLWTGSSFVAAAINVALSIYWVQRIGAAGVVLGTIVSYLLVLVLPQLWQCHKLLRVRS